MKVIIKDRIIDLTPEIMAIEFANMHSDQQAKFFNALCDESNKWTNSFCFQLQAITDEPGLDDGARYIMQQIGEYSQKA